MRGASGVPIPSPSPTLWPTLIPLGTPSTNIQTNAPQNIGPQLLDKFRVRVDPQASSIYSLRGDVEYPVRIEVIVLSGDIDPTIYIGNASGDRLASVNRGKGGEPETIGQFQFPSTGYYELGFGSASGEGELGVSIYQLDPAILEGGGAFTSMNQELRGTIRQPASYHTFSLPVERGQRFDLSAIALSDGLDLQLELYGPDGKLLQARDDNIGKDPYLWNFMPAQSGTYMVVISNCDEHIGDYVLGVGPSISGEEAVIGTRTQIELSTEPRKSTWLTFDGSTPDGVLVDVRPISSDIDIIVAVYDPYGNRVALADLGASNERELLSFIQFPFDGSYQVEFDPKSGGGQIEYYIRPIRQVDINLGGKITPGRDFQKGEMTGPGMVLAYTFDAQASDLVGINAEAVGGTGLDLGFDLYSPDGYLLVSKDDDVGKDPVLDGIELPKSGRYVLLLWNYGKTTGPFELYLTKPEIPSAPPGNNQGEG
ncbi:MAG: hypothetical protein JXB07_00875 [Anaerolineae bacterium]|nr:hypothetical protein [Anaerolineae bacterium]